MGPFEPSTLSPNLKPSTPNREIPLLSWAACFLVVVVPLFLPFWLSPIFTALAFWALSIYSALVSQFHPTRYLI